MISPVASHTCMQHQNHTKFMLRSSCEDHCKNDAVAFLAISLTTTLCLRAAMIITILVILTKMKMGLITTVVGVVMVVLSRFVKNVHTYFAGK